MEQAESVTDPDERTERDDAANFLREFLADGPKSRKEVMAAGKADGYSESTLKRARSLARVDSVRDGYGGGAKWGLRDNQSIRSAPEPDSRGLNGKSGLNAANKGLQETEISHSGHSGQGNGVGDAELNGEPIPEDQLLACQAVADRENLVRQRHYTGRDVWHMVLSENRSWLTVDPQWAQLGYKMLMEGE